MADFPDMPITAATEEAASPGDDPAVRKRALLIVFLVVAIDLLGFGLVLPLLPRYGKAFLGPAGESLQGGLILGALMASFSAMQFFFSPIWGRVSDRVGRRPILLLGLLSSVVFYSLFGVASMLGREGWREIGLILLFASRIGAGIAGATLGTAQAAIADSTSQRGRSRGMAIIGAGFGVGFTFGPVLGYAALRYAPEFIGGPGFAAAGFSLIALVLGVFLLPETRHGGSRHGGRRWSDLARGLQTALRTPIIGTLILIFFLATLAFANFEPTLAYLTQTMGLDDQDNLLVFAYVGLVLALVQGGLYRPLAKRVNEITFTWLGTALMAVGMAGLGVIAYLASDREHAAELPLLGILLIILALAVTGFAFMTPSVQALISRLGDPERQGEILGVNQSASAMARILGPAAGVPLYNALPSHIAPYIFGTALLVLVLVLTLRIQGPVMRRMS
jgi:DHA1 family tetracycline resistance protein-like MFS transporter